MKFKSLMMALADRVGTKTFAHGCTGMGNDQVRFDQSVRSLGDYDIIAPIREIQKQHVSGTGQAPSHSVHS